MRDWKVAFGPHEIVYCALADKVALVKEMQYHPISGDVIHADFYEVDLTAKMTVSVPLHFVGKAPVLFEVGSFSR